MLKSRISVQKFKLEKKLNFRQVLYLTGIVLGYENIWTNQILTFVYITEI